MLKRILIGCNFLLPGLTNGTYNSQRSAPARQKIHVPRAFSDGSHISKICSIPLDQSPHSSAQIIREK